MTRKHVLRWEEVDLGYCVARGYLGKLYVASIHYYPSRKGQGEWDGILELSGASAYLDHNNSPEETKLELDLCVYEWLDKAGLKVK